MIRLVYLRIITYHGKRKEVVLALDFEQSEILWISDCVFFINIANIAARGFLRVAAVDL